MKSRIGLETIDVVELGEERIAVKRGWLSILIKQLLVNSLKEDNPDLPLPLNLESASKLESWYDSETRPTTYSLGLSWAALRGVAIFSQGRHSDSIHTSHNFLIHAYNKDDYTSGAMMEFAKIAHEDFVADQSDHIESLWTEIPDSSGSEVELCKELGYRTLSRTNGLITLVKDV